MSKTTEMTLPNFLIVGGMRCGSTTLWEVMKSHPEIYFPDTKELHYFDDRNGSFERGLAWYGRNFEDCGCAQLKGEATPNYFYLPEARDRIHENLPQIKTIVILRDPVKRAWSHYWFRRQQGLETESFRKALDMENDRINQSNDWSKYRFAYRQLSQFGDHLENWRMKFEDSQIHVLFLEDLVKDSQPILDGLFSFLGVAPPFHLPKSHRNEARYTRSAKLQWIGKRLETFRSDQRSSIARAIRKLGRSLLVCNMSKVSPILPYDIENQLRVEFRESDRKLELILGRRIPWR